MTVGRGASFEQVGPDAYRVDPASREDMARLLRARPGACDGAVFLWPLDAPALAEAAGPAVAQAALLGGALHLTQALLHGGPGARLWLATRGAQPAGGAAPILPRPQSGASASPLRWSTPSSASSSPTSTPRRTRTRPPSSSASCCAATSPRWRCAARAGWARA